MAVSGRCHLSAYALGKSGNLEIASSHTDVNGSFMGKTGFVQIAWVNIFSVKKTFV
jgi:hypothetical protein